jgi:hypothetical protein
MLSYVFFCVIPVNSKVKKVPAVEIFFQICLIFCPLLIFIPTLHMYIHVLRTLRLALRIRIRDPESGIRCLFLPPASGIREISTVRRTVRY